LHPTEPANYTGSNTSVSKQIVDVEIAMHQSAGIITETITIESLTTVTIATELLLLQLTVSGEKKGV
jgi:hypothetical protein